MFSAEESDAPIVKSDEPITHYMCFTAVLSDGIVFCILVTRYAPMYSAICVHFTPTSLPGSARASVFTFMAFIFT